MDWKIEPTQPRKKANKKEKKRERRAVYDISNPSAVKQTHPIQKKRIDPGKSRILLCPHTVCLHWNPLSVLSTSYSSPAINLLRLFCCTGPAAPLATLQAGYQWRDDVMLERRKTRANAG